MTAIPFVQPLAPSGGRRAAPVRATTGAAWWLALILVSTLLGFRGTMAKGPGGLDLAHAAHGTIALGWSLILIVQAALADANRRRAHRLFAVAGMACAAGLVATSVPMLHTLAGGAVASERFRPMGYQLLAMDVLLMALFVALFAVAMAFVRTPGVHSRALAATGVLALPAGLGRAYMSWFGLDPIGGSHLALLTAAVILLALTVRDRRAGVHETVFPATLLAVITLQLAFPLLARMAWFDQAARVFAAA
jgi:hypothetical protein